MRHATTYSAKHITKYGMELWILEVNYSDGLSTEHTLMSLEGVRLKLNSLGVNAPGRGI